jgi:predicted esterase
VNRRWLPILLIGCGSTDSTPKDAAPDTTTMMDASPDDSAMTDTGADSGPAIYGKCGDPVPMGATPAPDPPAYMGTCPTIADPPAFNTIATKGNMRRYLVYRPQPVMQGEKLPVVFVWHYLGSDPLGMAGKIDAQNAANAYRMILVIPEAKGDVLFKWPFEASQPQARIDEELAFFDDMFACTAQSLAIDKNCVSSMGVSAGALFTDQLAHMRSDRLSSFVSLSGGTGGNLVRPWAHAEHQLPAIVLWGGMNDLFPPQFPVLYFETLSKNLETDLDKDGHFIVECIHNCGHAVPPFEYMPPLEIIWRFLLDHPFWESRGASVYSDAGLPKSAPTWCAIGKGKATPRDSDAACQ